MSTNEPNGDKTMIQAELYELRASQEEFYLEETEEELRMILECDETTLQASDASLPDPKDEIEDLLTGDSDEPPLSEDQVVQAPRKF